VATALGTGVRISELLALTWEDVDMTRGQLHIRRALAQDNVKHGPVFGPTKNEQGRRIPMAGFVREALQARASEVQREKDFYADAYHSYGLVFCKPDGRPYDPRYISQRFRELLRQINAERETRARQEGRQVSPEELLPLVRFHDLRHSCASFLLAQGVHPKVVQEILGHRTIQITMDTYSHLLPGVDAQATRALDQLLQ